MEEFGHPDFGPILRVYREVHGCFPNNLTAEQVVERTAEALGTQDCGVERDLVKRYLEVAVELNISDGAKHMLCRAGEYTFGVKIHSTDALTACLLR